MKNLLLAFIVFFVPLLSLAQDDKVYKVVISSDWKPYYLINEKGYPDGYAIELFEILAKRIGIKYEYVIKNNFQEILNDLSNARADIMPNMSITPQRREQFVFTQSTDDFLINIYKRTNAKHLETFTDLNYTTMGIVPTNICNKLIEKQYPQIQKRYYSTYLELVEALLKNEVESFCYPKPLVDKGKDISNEITTFNQSLREIKRGMAIASTQADLAPLFNQAINELRMSGELSKLHEKWFQKEKFIELTRSETIFIVISFLGITFTALVIAFYFINKKKWLMSKAMLEKEVAKSTHLLRIQNKRLKKVHRKLQQQLNKDVLTCIYNRKFFNEKIEELLALNKRYRLPFSFLMLDIDDFKNINDTYGHDMGDKVLVDLTHTVQNKIRNTDFFFRVGGEEFVVLFADTSLKDALPVAQKIKELIETQVHSIPDKKITASFGLTEVQKHDTADTICKRADTLLYTAKANGKNQIQYDTIAIF